jgi:hypothetical protein
MKERIRMVSLLLLSRSVGPATSPRPRSFRSTASDKLGLSSHGLNDVVG